MNAFKELEARGPVIEELARYTTDLADDAQDKETAEEEGTGNDAAGSGLRDYLADAGVDVSRVDVKDQVPTGTALIVVANGENSIIVVLGANEHVGPDCMDGISFTEEDIVVAQFETPIETTHAAFISARKAGARTILNPSPAAPIQPELLGHIDFLVVNEHEFELIFETPLAPVLNDDAGGMPDVTVLV